jgi:hypothetical protein
VGKKLSKNSFAVIALSILFTNTLFASPSNAWDNGTWGREDNFQKTLSANERFAHWIINYQTMSTIAWSCANTEYNKDFSKFTLQVYLPLTNEIKKKYKIKSKKKSAWINVSKGVKGGTRFNFPSGYYAECSLSNNQNIIFNWFPPKGINNVPARVNHIGWDNRKVKIPSLDDRKGFIYPNNESGSFGIIVHPQMSDAISKASQQVAQGSGNVGLQNSGSAPQANSGNAPQTSTSSTTFVNPYNISGVGRVLQDGSIEYGVYYGGNRQLSIDLTSGNFYAAAQNTASNAGEAEQMCIASNLASGNYGGVASC